MKRRLSLRGRMVMTAVVAAGVALAVLLLVAGPDARAPGPRRRLRQPHRRGAAHGPRGRGAARAAARPRTGSTPGGRGRPRGRRAGHGHRPGRPRARRLGGLRAPSSQRGREPRRPARGAGRARRAASRAPSAAARPSGRDLLYAAVPVRRDGRGRGRRAPVAAASSAIEAQGRDLLAQPRALALACWRSSRPGSSSLLLSASLGRSLERDHGDRPAVRERATSRRASGCGREDELGELARIINQSADQLQGRLAEIARDRGPHRRHPLRDGRRRPRRRPPGHRDPRQPEPRRRRMRPRARRSAATTWRSIRQREVGALVEEVLRSGERARGRGGDPASCGASSRSPPCPSPASRGRPARRRAHLQRRDRAAAARARSGATSWPTPPTSCARRSPRSAASWRRSRTAPWTSRSTAQRFLGKIRTHADRMAALVEDLLELSPPRVGRRARPSWDGDAPCRGGRGRGGVLRGAGRRARPLTLRHEARGGAAGGDRPRAAAAHPREPRRQRGQVHAGRGAASSSRRRRRRDGAARIEVARRRPRHRRRSTCARIFERFYRVDKARSRELGGTGLGLSIVKHLAESMGAPVSVESEPGRGSRFTVVLPAAASRPTTR